MNCDIAIIGAGVIGLACAKILAEAGHAVVVLEAEKEWGSHTSSRNSEVIHAGLYYPTGSLKAALAVAGKKLLYRYCQSRAIAFRACGKFLVAAGHDAAETDRQITRLAAIKAQAAINGVDDLSWVSGQAMARLEPQLYCAAALYSPSTGIIDAHQLMLAYLADAEAAGAILACNSPVSSIRQLDGGFRLLVQDEALDCHYLVNAAGLGAQALLAKLEGFDPHYCPPLYYAKGNYFTLTGKSPFAHLIYPVPEQGGLGVHVTIDLAGRCRFGPDVEWCQAKPDYQVDAGRATHFATAIKRYFPGLQADRLTPAYAGIRPKLVPQGAPDADFCIDGPAQHGMPGLVNLLGIESPGLTASLAIAELVCERLFQPARN